MRKSETKNTGGRRKNWLAKFRSVAVIMLSVMVVTAPAMSVLSAADDANYAPIAASSQEIGVIGAVPSQINLTLGRSDNPNYSAMGVNWLTDPSTTETLITYGRNADLSGANTRNAVRREVLTIVPGNRADGRHAGMDFEPFAYNRITLTGLTPGATYYYRIGSGANATEIFSFRAPAAAGDNTPFTFIALPDIQGQSFHPGATEAAINSATNTFNPSGHLFTYLDTKYPDLAFLLQLGDVTDHATSWSFMQYFRGGNDPGNAQELHTRMPFMGTVGNHETGATYDPTTTQWRSRFGNFETLRQPPAGSLPTNPERNGTVYAFDYGPAVFISLNIHYNSGTVTGAQEAFLRAEAARAHEMNKWIIVYMHTGPYRPSASNHFGVNSLNGRLFSELEVDLVLSGHEHAYMRTTLYTPAGATTNASGRNNPAANPLPGEVIRKEPGQAPTYISPGSIMNYGHRIGTYYNGEWTDFFFDIRANTAHPSEGGSTLGPTYLVVEVTPNTLTTQGRRLRRGAESSEVIDPGVTIGRVNEQPVGGGEAPRGVTFMFDSFDERTRGQIPNNQFRARFNWVTDMHISTSQQMFYARAEDFDSNGGLFTNIAAARSEVQDLRDALTEHGRQFITDRYGTTINSAIVYAGPFRHHKAVTSILEPNTEYVYVVGDGVNLSAPARFTTPSANPGDPFEFVFITDSHSAGTSLAESIATTTNFSRRGLDIAFEHYPNIEFILTGGDQTYLGVNNFHWEGFFRGNAERFATVPLFMTAGNHDHEGHRDWGIAGGNPSFVTPDPTVSSMGARHNIPRNGAAFFGGTSTPGSATATERMTAGIARARAANDNYFFIYNNTLFLILEWYDAMDGAGWGGVPGSSALQRDWMRSVVKQHPDVQWRVAVAHRSLSGYRNNFNAAWMQAFYESGIDLVLHGHDHIYARSNLLDAAGNTITDPNRTGTTLLTGYSTNTDRRGPLWWNPETQTGTRFREEHLAYVDIRPIGPGFIHVSITPEEIRVTGKGLDPQGNLQTAEGGNVLITNRPHQTSLENFVFPVTPPDDDSLPITAINLSGDALVGNTLGIAGLQPPTATVNFQWEFSADGTTWQAIPGNRGRLSQLIVMPEDLDMHLRVTAFGTGMFAGSSISSAATPRVINPDDVVVIPPLELGDTVYIDTVQDLLDVMAGFGSDEFPRNGHYILRADLDMTGQVFTPIGGAGGTSFTPSNTAMDNVIPFHGVFDGRGHTITGLTFNSGITTTYIGFITYVAPAARVINLKLADIDFTGRTMIGGIAAMNSGLIEQVHVTGRITQAGTGSASMGASGGIVAALFGGDIRDSISDVTVTSAVNVNGATIGGVVGTVNSGTDMNSIPANVPKWALDEYILPGWKSDSSVINTIAFGDLISNITASNPRAGGIIGRSPRIARPAGTADRSQSITVMGNVAHMQYITVEGTANGQIRRIVGSFEGTPSGASIANTIAGGPNFFSDGITILNGAPAEISQITTQARTVAQLANQSTYEDLDWDFSSEGPWYWDGVADRPALRFNAELPPPPPETTIYIGTADELLAIGTFSEQFPADGHYVLTADIDLAGRAFNGIGGVSGASIFQGVFDGRGHVISNVTITNTATITGFFRTIGPRGIVANLGLENVDITGTTTVGGLAGASAGLIQNSFVTGEVRSSNIAPANFTWSQGGMVGQLAGGTIKNSYSEVNVVGSLGVGGIAGSIAFPDGHQFISGAWMPPAGNIAQSAIINTYSTGRIEATQDGFALIGGIVGQAGVGVGRTVLLQNNVAMNASINRPNSSAGGHASQIMGYSYDVPPTLPGTNFFSSAVAGTPMHNNMPSVGATSVPAADLLNQATFEGFGWDFENVWYWDAARNVPILRVIEVDLDPDEQHTITFNVTGDGSINVEPAAALNGNVATVRAGGGVFVQLTPEPNWAIQSVIIDGVASPAAVRDGFFNVTNVFHNLEVDIVFRSLAEPRNITATADNGGTINPSGVVAVPHGSNQTFAFTANPGFQVDGVYVNNARVAANVNSFTKYNVTTPGSIHVTFELAEILTGDGRPTVTLRSGVYDSSYFGGPPDIADNFHIRMEFDLGYEPNHGGAVGNTITIIDAVTLETVATLTNGVHFGVGLAGWAGADDEITIWVDQIAVRLPAAFDRLAQEGDYWIFVPFTSGHVARVALEVADLGGGSRRPGTGNIPPYPTTPPPKPDGGTVWDRSPGYGEWRMTDMGAGGAFPVIGEGPGGFVMAGGDLAGIYVSLDGGDNWRNIPMEDLHISAMAFDPHTPGVAYLGTSGGLWRTIDWGQSFHRVVLGGYWTSIAVSADGMTVYATNNRDWIDTNTRNIFVSRDGGVTFTQRSLPDANVRMQKLLIHPQNHDIVFAISQIDRFLADNVANIRNIFVPGAWVSQDAGVTWSQIDADPRLVGADLTDIALDPNNPDIIYIGRVAGLGAPTWGMPDGHPDNGLFAVNWRTNTLESFQQHMAGVISFAADGTMRVISVQQALRFERPMTTPGQISGNWSAAHRIDYEFPFIRQSFTDIDLPLAYAKSVVQSMVHPDRYLRTCIQWMYISTDGMMSMTPVFTDFISGDRSDPRNSFWRGRGIANTVPHTIAVNPIDPNIVYAGFADLGFWRSIDGGMSWQIANDARFTGWQNGGGGAAMAIAPDPTRANVVWIAFGHETFDMSLLKSTDYGRTFTDVGGGLPSIAGTSHQGVNGGRIRNIAVDPNSPEDSRHIYVVVGEMGPLQGWAQDLALRGTGNYWVYKSTTGGNNFTRLSLPVGVYYTVSVDPNDSNIVFVGGASGLFRSADAGDTWTRIDGQNGNPRMDRPSHTGITDQDYEGILSIEIAPTNSNIIYVASRGPIGRPTTGTDFTGAGVFKSYDGGLTFIELDTGTDKDIIAAVAVHPLYENIVFETSSKPFRSGGTDVRGGVKLSTDGGYTWTEVNEGLSLTLAREIAISPADPGLVFIGSPGNAFMFRRFDFDEFISCNCDFVCADCEECCKVTPCDCESGYCTDCCEECEKADVLTLTFILYTNQAPVLDTFEAYTTGEANGLLYIEVPVILGAERATWPEQERLAAALGIGNIYGTMARHGYAFRGWFDDQTLDASDRIRDGLRRPALTIPGEKTCFLTDLLAQIEDGDGSTPALFADSNLDVYGVWVRFGDVDDNAIINMADLNLLQRHINFGHMIYVYLSSAAANVVVDDVINSADLSLLQRYINLGHMVPIVLGAEPQP